MLQLDLAALNAELIVRCAVDENKQFELLDKMYEKQKFGLLVLI